MSEKNELPKGWGTAAIGALVAPRVSQAGPAGNDSFTYVDISSIDNRRKLICNPKLLDTDEAPSRAKQVLEKGDVLVSMTRPNLNAVAMVPAELAGAIGSTGFDVLRTQVAEPKWFFYAVQSNDFIRAMCKVVQGALYPAVRPRDIRSYLLPIPPLNEQRRIVAKIEELFSDLDAGVAALERAKAKLKRYRAAVLKAAVEGRLTAQWRSQHPEVEPASKLLERILKERRRKWEEEQLRKYEAQGKKPPKNWKDKYKEPEPVDASDLPPLPEGWCWASVDQLTAGDRSSAYGVLQPGPNVPDGIPLVRVCDIADGTVAVDQLKRISPDVSSQYQRTVLRGREVLLTIVGTIGRTAVAPESLCGANTARAVAVLPMSEFVDARYVELNLREPSMRSRLTRAAHEVARKTLNLEDVRLAAIPLAPVQEQSQFVELLEQQLSIVEQAGFQIETNIQRASRLRQSILKRAFEGKLVPQDPEDEPAIQLLERIQSGREKHTGEIPSTNGRSGTRTQKTPVQRAKSRRESK